MARRPAPPAPSANVASVHRFREAVAAHLGGGETVYLTPSQAEQLGEALIDCARSVRTVSFQASTFGTIEVRKDPT